MFSASNVVTFFAACILGFEVAPHLALASRQAGWALRIAGVLLALDSGLAGFFVGFLYRLPFGELLVTLVPSFFFAGFWACLAWAAIALLSSSPASSRTGGPELR
ncbi:MAG: hypothetical protein U0228_26235 [Myxococcaceae bacterium]